MVRPDWNDAPEWANYMSMDESGKWYWWEHEPLPKFGQWWLQRDGKVKLALEADKPWSETLESRSEGFKRCPECGLGDNTHKLSCDLTGWYTE